MFGLSIDTLLSLRTYQTLWELFGIDASLCTFQKSWAFLRHIIFSFVGRFILLYEGGRRAFLWNPLPHYDPVISIKILWSSCYFFCLQSAYLYGRCWEKNFVGPPYTACTKLGGSRNPKIRTLTTWAFARLPEDTAFHDYPSKNAHVDKLGLLP